MKAMYEAIVVGGGFAGLATSYHLKKNGIDHLVFERGRAGESWRSQRWDSFRLNTANRLNSLPGMDYTGSEPDGFCSAAEFTVSLEKYVSAFDLPLVENAKVISIRKTSELFEISVCLASKEKNYLSRQVIIASGHANEIKIPAFASGISANVKQAHTSQYRAPGQIPQGAVLVVGSAQSGCQIAEDLADAGRKVYLSTSKVPRVPRWYRGRDIMDWLIDMKFFDMRADEIKDPEMLNMRPPQLTGIGGKRTISLQSLAKKGVTVLGKMKHAEGENLFFEADAGVNVKFADGFSKKVKEMVDGFVSKNNLSAPVSRYDENDFPNEDGSCSTQTTSLNIRKDQIGSIIWCTGFNSDHRYIKLPVFGEDGTLKQRNGITDVPGLHFLGLPWLRARKSVLIFGIREDAEFVGQQACKYARQQSSPPLS